MTFDDQMPSNVDAERVLLAAILLDANSFFEVEGKIKADDFHLDAHRRIFDRMTDLMRSSGSVDIVTLSNSLSRRNEDGSRDIAIVGGTAYIAGLTEGVPRRPVIGEYLRIVKDKSLLRQIMTICTATIATAQEQTDPAIEVLGQLEQNLDRAILNSQGDAELESVGQWLDKNDIFAERIPGVMTGLTEYDKLTSGLHPGELTIMGARTSTGKTSLAGTMTTNIARQNKCVAIFINEQQKGSFIGRMLCGRANVPFSEYRQGTMDLFEKDYIKRAREEFRTMPIYWDDRSSMSVASIRNKARALKRSDELDVIIVDQLSRVNGDGIYKKGMQTDELIGEKVSALKGIGKDLGVPIVVYHQLNRATTKNEGSRPQLENLGRSGYIEEHADVVAFLHRPGYYDRTNESLRDAAEIIIAKQRDGAVGVAECEFIGSLCKWQDKKEKR